MLGQISLHFNKIGEETKKENRWRITISNTSGFDLFCLYTRQISEKTQTQSKKHYEIPNKWYIQGLGHDLVYSRNKKKHHENKKEIGNSLKQIFSLFLPTCGCDIPTKIFLLLRNQGERFRDRNVNKKCKKLIKI